MLCRYSQKLGEPLYRGCPKGLSTWAEQPQLALSKWAQTGFELEQGGVWGVSPQQKRMPSCQSNGDAGRRSEAWGLAKRSCRNSAVLPGVVARGVVSSLSSLGNHKAAEKDLVSEWQHHCFIMSRRQNSQKTHPFKLMSFCSGRKLAGEGGSAEHRLSCSDD